MAELETEDIEMLKGKNLFCGNKSETTAGPIFPRNSKHKTYERGAFSSDELCGRSFGNMIWFLCRTG